MSADAVSLIAEVTGVTDLGGDSHLIALKLPSKADFLAGQYLELELAQGTSLPYSLASAPAALPHAELLILDQGPQSLSHRVLNEARSGKPLPVRLPLGDCVLRPEHLAVETELVLIAAGSGFAQMKAIMEQVVAEGGSNPVHLYWGVRHPDQLYGQALLERWGAAHGAFRFIPVVEEDNAPWRGRRGQVQDAVCADFERLDRCEVFICGSPAMVYATEDALRPLGLRPGHIHSDVFSYAPRTAISSSSAR